jgi:hypothetical protein
MVCTPNPILGRKRDGVRGDGGKYKMRRGEMCTGVWWGNLRERPLGRPRRRWEDNIRMDLEEVGCGCEEWIGLDWDRDRWREFVSAVRNRRVP